LPYGIFESYDEQYVLQSYLEIFLFIFWTEETALDFNGLHTWSKAIPALAAEDKSRAARLFNQDPKTLEELRQQFYSFVNMPLQSICTSGKFFGGEWLSHCGALDGHKYICLDKFYDDVQSGKCLIYSFGIANDWSFEEAMAQLGCTVRAFDPTIDGQSKPENDLVSVLM